MPPQLHTDGKSRMVGPVSRVSVLRACSSVGPPGAVRLGAARRSRLAAAPTPQQIEFFEAKIRPLLVESCFDCHTADEKGGLRLDSRDAISQGRRFRSRDRPRRPRRQPADEGGAPRAGCLEDAAQRAEAEPTRRSARLAEWITMGAPWPAATPGDGRPLRPRAVRRDGQAGTGAPIDPQLKAFWSFQPIRKVAVPQPANAAWAEDRHRPVRAGAPGARGHGAGRHRRQADADPPRHARPHRPAGDRRRDRGVREGRRRRTRSRRSSIACSRRRATASTWGRLWLDVARYAEDDPRSLDPMGRGYAPYPNAYLYRDWVIKAFNDDLPYDQFVKAQIAADQLDEKSRVRHLPALGFLGLGPWYYDNGAVEITRADERHDRVDVVSRGFLGLTVACARCHDHKYDPICGAGLLRALRRLPQHPVHRVPAGAEVGRRRVQGGREEDQGQGEAARRVHEHREPSARRRRWRCRPRSTCARRGRCRASRRRTSPSSRPARSSITSCSTAG